jgi:hypothetical protein
VVAAHAKPIEACLPLSDGFRSPICVLCSEHRWPKERTPPSLADFRYDNFQAFVPEFSPDYMAMVRDICLHEAGFEPKFEPVANTLASVLSMVAAGRGVFLRPLIGLCEHLRAGS